MEDKLNKATKVFLLLNSIKEYKTKYVAVVNPINNEKIMKMKITLDDEKTVEDLETFFDNGFKIEAISKEEFNDLKTEDILNFNLD